MTSPSTPIPDAQVQAFGQRVMAYVGVDPDTVLAGESFNWWVEGGEKFGTVQFKVVIPSDDIIAMFNGHDVEPTLRLYPRSADIRAAADALHEKLDELTKFRHWTVRQVARGTVITCVGYLRALADDIAARGH